MFGNIFNSDAPGQLYHVGATGISCELAEASDALKQYIHYYWLLRISESTVDLEVIPDAAIDLVLSPNLPDFSCIYLPTAEKFNISLQGPVIYSGVSFHTQSALTMFDCSLEQLASLEQGLETTNALSISPLVKDIQNAEQLDVLRLKYDQFFNQSLATLTLPNGPTIKGLIDHLDPASIEEIARRAGMSERQFRRTTTNLTGLSPKQLQRVMRLQSTLHTLFDQTHQPERDAFYDDSHKIKEFKQLTGLTQGQIQKLAEKYNR